MRQKLKTAAVVAKDVCFGSPQRTTLTVGATMLLMSGAKTIYDCATGNCNKTPEELHQMFHILHNTTLTVGEKVAENIGIRVVAPVVTGVFAGATQAIGSRFASMFCGKKASAQADEAARLLNDATKERRVEGDDLSATPAPGATAA